MSEEVFLALTGVVAGLIDSIAGGGGLITLPVLSNILEPGAHAIGTNKIVGVSGAFIAFAVYFLNLKKRGGKFPLKKGIVFLVSIGLGSLLGSFCSPLLPKVYFRYLLVIACPLILWVLWNKQLFMAQVLGESGHSKARIKSILICTGIGVGFYDGFFGPGGGTFMLIGLLWAVKLPLFEALLLSKLANTISAGASLVSYGFQGYVHVAPGLIMASGMVVGGFVGARLATQRSEKIVRPVLVFVVLLLFLGQVKELING